MMMMMMIIVLEIIDTCNTLRITARIPVVLPGTPFPPDIMLNPPAHFLISPSNSQHVSP